MTACARRSAHRDRWARRVSSPGSGGRREPMAPMPRPSRPRGGTEKSDARDGEAPFKFTDLNDDDFDPVTAELDKPGEGEEEDLRDLLGSPERAAATGDAVYSPTSAGGDVQQPESMEADVIEPSPARLLKLEKKRQPKQAPKKMAEALLVEKLPEDLRFVYGIVRDFGGDTQKFLSEVYSVPRVTAMASKIPSCGVVPGFAFDLKGCNAQGKPWDFRGEGMRREAKQMLEVQKPWVLIGSPRARRSARGKP